MTTAWPEVALGEVADLIRGVTFKPADVKELGTPGTIACLRTANVQAELAIDDVWAIPEAFARRPDQHLRVGDIVISSANSWNLVGKCSWVGPLPWPATFGGFVTTLRARPDTLDARYLYRWFSSPKIQAVARSFGRKTTNISNLDLNRCRAMLMPLPPVEEQQRIATILDAADQGRVKRRESLAMLDSLTESIFLDMFRAELRGEIECRLVELNELIDQRRPICYGILKPGPDLVDGEPYIRVVDMTAGGIDHRSIRRTSKEISHQYRRAIVRTGDLLMSIRGHVGRLAMVPPELDGANITQDSARIAVEGAEPGYVLEYLRLSMTQAWMMRNTKGAAVKGINIGDVRRIPVLLPSRRAQQDFVRRARSVKVMSSNAQSSLNYLDELFASLEQRAFKGDL